MDDPIDDLVVRLKDDLHDDPGDRPLDGPLHGLQDDLMDDLRNHDSNPRPCAGLRKLTGLRHLGDCGSFVCHERLSGYGQQD